MNAYNDVIGHTYAFALLKLCVCVCISCVRASLCVYVGLCVCVCASVSVSVCQGLGAFSGSSLFLSLTNSGITTVGAEFLSGIGCPVTVDLSQNNVTRLPIQSFQFVGSVNLSHNVRGGLLQCAP